MSQNFTGVTFAKQKVSPADDGAMYRAIFQDGILSGCEIGFVGTTLTMAAGRLMICGRQIRHPFAQSWAVADAITGYARLLLTIDLSRASQKDYFDQVVETIEYATAADGFPELEQSDINGTGIRYQVPVCVVSLGNSGITGIVSQLEKTRVSGGLNFKVVGGTTQPADPAENTIWVKTDEKVTNWLFSPDRPDEPKDGMVWIKTDVKSSVAFNALQTEGVIICPAAAYQYRSGVWASVKAESYANGSWISWPDWFVIAGESIHDLKAIGLPLSAGFVPMNSLEVLQVDGAIQVNGNNGYGIVYQDAYVDLTNYNILKIEGYFSFNGKDPYKLVVWSEIGSYITSNVVASAELSATGAALDVSELSGSYIVGISLADKKTQFIRNLYLE